MNSKTDEENLNFVKVSLSFSMVPSAGNYDNTSEYWLHIVICVSWLIKYISKFWDFFRLCDFFLFIFALVQSRSFVQRGTSSIFRTIVWLLSLQQGHFSRRFTLIISAAWPLTHLIMVFMPESTCEVWNRSLASI